MSYNQSQKREIIMEHYLKPQNKKDNIKDPIVVYGTSCSDTLEYELILDNNAIRKINFDGSGCAFFIASTDLLINLIEGKTIDQALYFIDTYKKFLLEEKLSEQEKNMLQELQIFENVKKQFNRLNCALMLANSLIDRLKIS